MSLLRQCARVTSPQEKLIDIVGSSGLADDLTAPVCMKPVAFLVQHAMRSDFCTFSSVFQTAEVLDNAQAALTSQWRRGPAERARQLYKASDTGTAFNHCAVVR